MTIRFALIAFALAALLSRGTAYAQAGVLGPCDDCSSEAIDMGFTIKFFGQEYSRVFVNNNGNVTFDAPLSAYTPFGLTETRQVIIAPFFADVDTRTGGVVSYVHEEVDGRQRFHVSWAGVGYFSAHNDKVNTFSLVLVDAGDGDFDLVFEYSGIGWETGDASGGVEGLGGSSAHVGFSNGTGIPETAFELPGSGVPGSFVDGGSRALISNLLNAPRSGVYAFAVRGGTIGQADLQMIKVWTPGSRKNEIIFTFRVDNLGPGTATDIVVLDPLPAEVEFVSTRVPCFYQAQGPMTGPLAGCVLPELAAGAFRTFDVVVKKVSTNGFRNTAAVAGAQLDPDEANNVFTTPVGLAADCTDQIRIRSGPSKLTFTPTGDKPSKRKAVLQISNQSDVSVDVRNIEPLDGAPFTINAAARQPIFPNVPKTIKAGQTKEFVVRLVREAGASDAEAKRPYFRIGLECARPPAAE
jgi:uncharacterized repeat protein (TIGR01451 family)